LVSWGIIEIQSFGLYLVFIEVKIIE
jgi:hypothetical protein